LGGWGIGPGIYCFATGNVSQITSVSTYLWTWNNIPPFMICSQVALIFLYKKIKLIF